MICKSAEKEFGRIWHVLVKSGIETYFPDKNLNELWQFAWYHYKPLPFHNFATHIAPGILYIMNESRIKPEINETLKDLIRAYFTHDARHNGISAESPELFSAYDAFEFYGSDAYTLPIIMTKFPYENKIENKIVELIRKVDVIRPIAGLSSKLLGIPNDTEFISFIWESFGYHIELGLDFLDWLKNGELLFFFPLILQKIEEGFFGNGLDCVIKKIKDNEKKLQYYLSCHSEKLLKAEEYRQNGCTYSEFVKHCWEIEIY